MQITITARHFELTKAIRDYVETSCLKLKKYFDHIISVHAVLALENSRNICELSMHAAHFSLNSASEEMDMYLTIDTAVDKMEAQIKKLKDRVTDHQKRALKDQFDAFSRSSIIELGGDTRTRKTIKTKRAIADIMSVHDAIAKIEETKDEFLIFKNQETDSINVLVKQDLDHFRLIEP